MKLDKLKEMLEILEKTHPDIDVQISLDSRRVPNYFELWKDLRNKGLECYMEIGGDCRIIVQADY